MPEPFEELLKTIAEVEAKIANGEIAHGLRVARAAGGFPDPEQELIQLLARWNAAEREMLESLISEDDFKVERARITKRFLQFLGEIRQRLEQETTSGKSGTSMEDGTSPLPDYDG